MSLTDVQPTVNAAGAAAFVHSEVFARTFQEGMALVEETANFLDGEGRDASKSLPRKQALAYAGASMRLTTQLMQIASWLLVLRAVREGDMTVDEVRQGKYRLPEKEPVRAEGEDLPEALARLISSTEQLYARIGRLDAEIFSVAGPQDGDGRNGDALARLSSLKAAFNR